MNATALFEYGLAFLTLYVSVFFILLLLENRHVLKHNPKPSRYPPISIIIPAYNEEKSIAATIESVLAAEYPNKKQIIVINDGSKDSTLAKARAFAKRGVLVLDQPNKGKGAALNNGLRHVNGELVVTLDSDSFIERNALMKLVGFFDDPTVGAVTSVMKVHEPRNTLQRLQRVEYLITVFNRRVLSFINSINVTPGPLSVFRRSVFDKVGGYDEHNILEDQEMALRIQAADYKIESSMEGVVYTKTPRTLRELVRQRVRWHRGGVRNLLKHYYLINPRYGDFGIVIMPLGILSMLAIFVVIAISALTLLHRQPGLLEYGLSNFIYTFSPMHLLGVMIFLGTLAWTYVGIKSIDGETVNPLEILAYVVIYAPLITLFWLVTVFKEAKREKLRW